MRHCMLDLETMGLRPGCAILSIGAVGFDAEGTNSLARFKRNIDLQSCLDAGLWVDPSTEAWWSEQSAAARAALLTPDPVPLKIALADFAAFYEVHKFRTIWSHGQSTDIPWLEVAYHAADLEVPWHYRAGRDTRTAYMLADLAEEDMAEPVVEHCALEDAVAQAKNVSECLRRIHMVLGHTL